MKRDEVLMHSDSDKKDIGTALSPQKQLKKRFSQSQRVISFTSRNRNKHHVIFPEKLMTLLNEGLFDKVMRWLPDGDAFCILNQEQFSEKVLKEHFRCKFESFTRKLNRWYVTCHSFMNAFVSTDSEFYSYLDSNLPFLG